MLPNVGGDRDGEETVAGVAVGESGAESRGGDVFVDTVEDVNAGALGVGKGEAVGVGEAIAGAADDDPFGEGEGLPGFAPVAQGMEGVRADEVKEIGGGVLLAEAVEGIYGVVGAVAREGCVKVGGDQVRIFGAKEGDHGEPVAKGGGGTAGLEGLEASGGEENLVEGELGGRGAGDGEVAAVGGVEAAAEEGYTHGGEGGLGAALGGVGRWGVVCLALFGGYFGGFEGEWAVGADHLGDGEFERLNSLPGDS